jgi:hypothetical protein
MRLLSGECHAHSFLDRCSSYTTDSTKTRLPLVLDSLCKQYGKHFSITVQARMTAKDDTEIQDLYWCFKG